MEPTKYKYGFLYFDFEENCWAFDTGEDDSRKFSGEENETKALNILGKEGWRLVKETPDNEYEEIETSYLMELIF